MSVIESFEMLYESRTYCTSSLITLLLWIYYAAQILLFGGEFTQVYANTYGTLVQPKKHAVKVERTEREVTL